MICVPSLKKTQSLFMKIYLQRKGEKIKSEINESWKIIGTNLTLSISRVYFPQDEF